MGVATLIATMRWYLRATCNHRAPPVSSQLLCARHPIGPRRSSQPVWRPFTNDDGAARGFAVGKATRSCCSIEVQTKELGHDANGWC